MPPEEHRFEAHYDWNQDKAQDRVAILPPGREDFFDIVVYLSAVGGPQKIVGNQRLLYRHTSPGPRLELLPDGGVKFILDHTGVGGAEHIHQWTVHFSDKRFWLTRYEYEFTDHVDSSKHGTCDVPFEIGEHDLNLIDVDFQPRACKFRFKN